MAQVKSREQTMPWWVFLITGIAWLAVALACAVAVANISTAQEPRRGGTLTVITPSDVSTFDPHPAVGFSVRVFANIYEPLFRKDEKGVLTGHLAQSWRFLDPTKLQITLRKGVKFHSGNELTAEDVKFTYERQLNPADLARDDERALASAQQLERGLDQELGLGARDQHVARHPELVLPEGLEAQQVLERHTPRALGHQAAEEVLLLGCDRRRRGGEQGGPVPAEHVPQQPLRVPIRGLHTLLPQLARGLREQLGDGHGAGCARVVSASRPRARGRAWATSS